ncbi:MAG: Transketolase [Parcubacteria group bacterium GW2011_GWC2_42_6]|nr:MAG: Transketolase [Parcubacteria group bacterium GW2011_GWC2_42_6]
MYNILNHEELEALKKAEPQRFQHLVEGGAYLDLRQLALAPLAGIDKAQTEQLAKIIRGLAFVAIDSVKSGHPGGSSSKVEQMLALLLSEVMAFDPLEPKHPGRDRLVWSAGHCCHQNSPRLHSPRTIPPLL